MPLKEIKKCLKPTHDLDKELFTKVWVDGDSEIWEHKKLRQTVLRNARSQKATYLQGLLTSYPKKAEPKAEP